MSLSICSGPHFLWYSRALNKIGVCPIGNTEHCAIFTALTATTGPQRQRHQIAPSPWNTLRPQQHLSSLPAATPVTCLCPVSCPPPGPCPPSAPALLAPPQHPHRQPMVRTTNRVPASSQGPPLTLLLSVGMLGKERPEINNRQMRCPRMMAVMILEICLMPR